MINEYEKSIGKNQRSEQFIKQLLEDVITTNEHLEKIIEDKDNTQMQDLDDLVESIKKTTGKT
jgi:Asp-tRNA(Asn)/Glu-tRNA(Gln) amidotransferase B subunit